MKNVFIALVAIATIAAMASCTDPIHNGDPVDTSYSLGFPLDEFHQLGEAGNTAAQQELVDQYRKRLTANVVRRYPEIQDEKNIKFMLGSGYVKNLEAGSGKKHSGSFKNELIIIIDDPNVHETLFLACGNGVMDRLRLSRRHTIDLGTAEKWRFIIEEGQGLAHHLPQLQAWAEVANTLNIHIKDKNGNTVPYETYLNTLGEYTTGLFAGDVIDVFAREVRDKDGNIVDFEKRAEATKKANAKIAAAKDKNRKRR